VALNQLAHLPRPDGCSLLLSGLWRSPGRGLSGAGPAEESLIYRLRGFSAIGVIAGCFLIFLCLILHSEPPRPQLGGISRSSRRGVESLQAAAVLRRRVALGMLAFLMATVVASWSCRISPLFGRELLPDPGADFRFRKLWVDAPPRPEFSGPGARHGRGKGRFFAKAFPDGPQSCPWGEGRLPWAMNLPSAVTLIWPLAGGRLLPAIRELAVVGIIL